MQNTGQPSAEVKASVALTEADVVAWLNERALSYDIPGLYFNIDAERLPCVARCKTDSDAFGCGQTFDDAVNMIRPRIRTNDGIAMAKRAEAERLLAEADALCPPVVPVPVILDKEGAA